MGSSFFLDFTNAMSFGGQNGQSGVHGGTSGGSSVGWPGFQAPRRRQCGDETAGGPVGGLQCGGGAGEVPRGPVAAEALSIAVVSSVVGGGRSQPAGEGDSRARASATNSRILGLHSTSFKAVL